MMSYNVGEEWYVWYQGGALEGALLLPCSIWKVRGQVQQSQTENGKVAVLKMCVWAWVTQTIFI
jgi:hypothetical protein